MNDPKSKRREGSAVGDFLKAERERQGLSTRVTQERIGWPDKGGRGQKVWDLEGVKEPAFNKVAEYAAALGISGDELMRAAGVDPPPEPIIDGRTLSQLVAERALAATGRSVASMTAILGVDSDDVAAWRDGSARMPDDVAKRLLLMLVNVPLSHDGPVDVEAQADAFAAIDVARRGGRRRRGDA